MFDFFVENESHIKSYAKYLENCIESSSLGELYEYKAKLIVACLIEIVQNKYGNKDEIAINNLGSAVESILKSSSNRTKEQVEVDIDTLVNFLCQICQEIILREDRLVFTSSIDLLNYIFYDSRRTVDEKHLALMLTGKLPIQIHADKFNSRRDGIYSRLKDVDTKIESHIQKLETLESTKATVDELSKDLENKKVLYKFLGLSSAFKEFNREKTISMFASFVLMLLILAALLMVPYHVLYNGISDDNEKDVKSAIYSMDTKLSAHASKLSSKELKEFKEAADKLEKVAARGESNKLLKVLLHYMPLITVEVILFYLFRLAYQAYSSARSQKMQLQMRNALCQFLETYIKFKNDYKEQSGSFDKFEAYIFSGMAPNDDKVPSTFDGMEQLATMIKELKG